MFSKNALKVLEKRYLLRDEQGGLVETAEELFRRVAAAVASAECHLGGDQARAAAYEKRFYELMMARRFMPNSPTLMNAGKSRGQLSACFVLPVPDSLEGIFETCKNAALIHQTGGGTGFSFSRLRPARDRVATTAGVASGPVSFMAVYDAATEAIRQGGTRRGANMGILHVSHPDIEEFITCKRDTSRLNNFNISIAITDEFMAAVEEDRDFDLVNPRNHTVVRTVRARDLFEKIIENAHATGEPGIVFIDRINAADPLIETIGDDGQVVPGTEDIEATNPCGEQPLGPGDACNLGSINLAEFASPASADMNWQELGETVELSVRFLDNIIESNSYPLPFIARAALSNRRIGLGVMGWAEALIKMGLAYDSDEAVSKAEQVMAFVTERAHEASRRLAEERGVFPNWSLSKWAQQGIRLRNATVTTIAPTGTISIIAGTSSGIEPLFAISFIRRVMDGDELVEVNPLFEAAARERGFYSDELMQTIAQQGNLHDLPTVPDDVKRLFVCSHDIPFIWHVRMQAAFQKHTDCAVSKTINFPEQATAEDVRSAYLKAWELGLKGITVYRDTSRRTQVLNISRTDPLKKGDSASHAGTVKSPRTAGAAAAVSNKDKFSRNNIFLGEQPAARSAGRNSLSCPECGTSTAFFSHFEACSMCHSCGYTKC
jgi:ribonucleoside-diphosphate reductase alpha chain